MTDKYQDSRNLALFPRNCMALLVAQGVKETEKIQLYRKQTLITKKHGISSGGSRGEGRENPNSDIADSSPSAPKKRMCIGKQVLSKGAQLTLLQMLQPCRTEAVQDR